MTLWHGTAPSRLLKTLLPLILCPPSMAASPAQVLSPGVGAAVVVSLAIGFSVLMLAIIFLQGRYAPATSKEDDNDEFASASRSIKPGLVACSIVSAWSEWLDAAQELFKLVCDADLEPHLLSDIFFSLGRNPRAKCTSRQRVTFSASMTLN